MTREVGRRGAYSIAEVTAMYGHDWEKVGAMHNKHMAALRKFLALPDQFLWECRKCGALVEAADSACLPGIPNLNGRHLTCEEVIIKSVHES
jgi:ABC-type ATPase with predicted acetyltransferase domain